MEEFIELGNHEYKNCLGLCIGNLRVVSVSSLVLQIFPESESRWVNGREGWSAGKIIRKQFLLLSDCEGVIMANF